MAECGALPPQGKMYVGWPQFVRHPAFGNVHSAGVPLAVTQLSKPIQNTRITDSTAGKKLANIRYTSARTTVLYSKRQE